MPRNLDLTALRSFVAVADSGGVTRAAGFLNLTQSAVSMQLKRLEEFLDTTLLDRSGRGVTTTPEGDQLLAYARKMLALNDEAIGRMTAQEFEGEITLGVPHDIVYPHLPEILKRFAADYPRMRVNMISSYTTKLHELFGRGKCAMILTTETEVEPGGEVLQDVPLTWIGAPGGICWRQRPFRFGSGRQCIFRLAGARALEAQGIDWEMAVESDSDRTIEATVRADLAVSLMLEGTEPPFLERIDHGGALPVLPSYKIALYVSELANGPAERALADLVRDSYRVGPKPSSQRPSLSISAA